MEPEKKSSLTDILNVLSRMDKVTTIDESLIEAGVILKAFIYEDDECYVSILMLSPGARIKEHKHTIDSEAYFIVKTQELKVCEIGESHSLENPYSEWMPVLSIKYKI